MNDMRNTHGDLLSDSDRLTNIGRMLRKSSLDELPQLLNVIKGDMSIIGPRPLLPEYLPSYSEEQRRRHEVRPGITGLAQVRGRNQMLFSERLKNDLYYVDHLSFFLDLRILLLTLKSVLSGSAMILNGQSVTDVDDIELTKYLKPNNNSKGTKYEHQREKDNP